MKTALEKRNKMMIRNLYLTVLLSGCVPFIPKNVIINSVEKADYNYILCNDGKYDYNNGCIDDKLIEESLKNVYEIHDSNLSRGTSFIANNKVITANHIIDKDTKVWIGNQYETLEVKATKESAYLDLWVAEANKEGFKFGSYDDIKSGHEVYIIGNKEGKGLNVRRCKVSLRYIEQGSRLMLISVCDVNFGDSGSPIIALRDGKPEVVGMAIRKNNDYGIVISSDDIKYFIQD